jgi:endonuclease/exonuclease/phosphatase family metal-dependent hydrolase
MVSKKLLICSIIAGGLTGCATVFPSRALSCAASARPVLTPSVNGNELSTSLRVLTYNVEGLGFPARRNRAHRLNQIAQQLAAHRLRGTAPDIILFQEVFSASAQKALANTGYPAIVQGPRRSTKPLDTTRTPLPGRSKVTRGEIGLRLTSSGLAIASRYPIIAAENVAFSKRSCAGIDCLSNKGVMLARVMIPGVPTPVDVYNTHMNSQGASRAPQKRHRAAHARQVGETSFFIDATHDDRFPLVFGGDFNMRESKPRWETFSAHQPLRLVHHVCQDPTSACDVKMSWDGDEPWMDTQDLQFFWSGSPVAIAPISIEPMFDGSPGSPKLSDHDGLMVTYRLSWPARLASNPAC